ncbi:MAG: hypothetical protein GY796_06715, partial [Chloroflexi bacterium]|nr:hypothetical protein [Chloroflexota bacterium]
MSLLLVISLLFQSLISVIQPGSLLAQADALPGQMSLVDEGQPFSLTAAQNSAAISITDSGFSPDTVTIPVDTAVIWTNNTTRSHILVSGNVQYRAYLPVILAANSNGNSHSQPTAVTADSFRVTIAPGDTFSYTYATIGAHPFYLETAPGTTGQVTVQDSSTSLTLDPIGNQTVTISNTLQLQLTAVYTGGGQLTYFANPLPANAALQPTSGAFQFTPDSSQIGSVSITFGVSDGVLTDTETIQMTVAPVSLSLNVVGPQTAVLGQTLSFTLTAAYEGQNSLTYGATTLPLPAQASLDAATGQFAFTPDENQIGDIGLNFYVTDGVLQASEWVTITVPPPNPSDDTALHGRILDANDAAVGVTTPLVGATVTNIETGINTTTNASGYFTLTGLISGTNHFDFQGSTAVPAGTYGAYRADKYLIGHVTTIVDRPIYIMALDTAGQVPVDPNNTTVVDNPNISTTVTIPPHTVMDENGNEYNGLISISPVPVGFTPGSLPDTLNPDQVITVQPMGLTFATPAPVTFPNSSGLSSGSKVDIWSMDHDLGIFFIAGTGQVSADGQWINTISGGIREASWHFPMSPAGDGNGGGDGPGDNDGNGPPCNGGSTVTLENGCLGTRISLPPYVSLGESRALELVYKSNRAYPQPVLPFEATILQRSAVPDLISYDLTVGGVNMGNPVYVDTSGLDENQDET